MTKRLPITALLLLALLSIGGCVTAPSAHDLNKNAEAIGKLFRQQQELIKARKTPAEVYGGVVQAEPYLASIGTVCKDQQKRKPSLAARLHDFFFNTDEQPHGLAASCVFFAELGKKFYAQMMLNSGKYYAANGEREKAERLLRGLLAEADKAQASETEQARELLDTFDDWDGFSPGWKAYLLADYATALKEYKANDDPRAWCKLGSMYDKGEGVPEDKKQAVKLYLKAAGKGVVLAQYQLGLHYNSGEGVEQSDKDADMWLSRAADQKYLPAKEALKKIKNDAARKN